MPERAGTYKTQDPRVLRAIAHPLRVRILHELDASGPSRAADLAHDLDIPANQASFHLRQLAKYGLVVDAPEAARDRRDRVWKVVNEHGIQLDLSEMDKVPGGPAAVDVWSGQSRGFSHAVVDAVYAAAREENAYGMLSQGALRLTRDEAKELADELAQVVDRWHERTRGRDAGRKTYMLMQVLQLYPDLAPGAEEAPDR
jgi:DNA-binding transcriptional ArsR family regulator